MRRRPTLREVLGTLAYDWPRLLWCLAFQSGWVAMRNRRDVIRRAPEAGGVRCEWEHTRPLHLCSVHPGTSRLLLRKALNQWPIRMRQEPPAKSAGDAPDVSFLIGHRGTNRLPQLLLTLASIAGQEDARCECVVVEQDVRPVIGDRLPEWIRYIHLPIPDGDMPYARSWAFNVAARAAHGKALVLHDNDMLAPARYAARIAELFAAGYEIAQLKRFIFYLGEHSTQLAAERGHLPGRANCDQVLQNAEAGGSVAITRDAFIQLGGMDESFIGWGGEDLEFWDRCLTRKTWRFGSMPMVHLWHPDQPGKRAINGLGADTASLTEERRGIPAEKRVQELSKRDWGQLEWSAEA